MTQQYSITQPRLLRKLYVIGNKEGILATVRFQGFANTRATAEFNNQSWEIKSNFMTNKVTISSGSETYNFDTGILTSAGTIEIDGKSYNFKSQFFKSKRTLVWLNDAEKELIKYEFGIFGGGLFKMGGSVEVSGVLIDPKALPILLSLGLYLYKTNYASSGTGAH